LSKQTFVIAIAGASGSGKSSIARETKKRLRDWYKVAVVAEDAYYRSQNELTMEQRRQTNYDHPDAIDETLLVEHLSVLKSGGTVAVPVYDYATHNRSDETKSVGPCEILIVEGILLLHRDAVREVADLSVFVDVAEDVCLERRMKRDIAQRGRTRESVLEQYESNVGPMYREFVQPSMAHADLVVRNEKPGDEATEVLLAQIKNMILAN